MILGQLAQHFFDRQNLTKNFPGKIWKNTYSCIMILGILFTSGSFSYYGVCAYNNWNSKNYPKSVGPISLTVLGAVGPEQY